MSEEAHKPSLWAYSAEFSDAGSLLAAAKRVHGEGYRKVEAYSPLPIHGLSDALGQKRTLIPWVIFVAGLGGLLGGLALITWTTVVDYPLVIGGRPLFSWPAFLPVLFECTVLAAGVTTVISLFASCGLPAPHHPVFETKNFERVSVDRFFLCIEAEDPKFEKDGTRRFLEGLSADAVTEVIY